MSSPSGSEPRTQPLYHAALAVAGGAILVIYSAQAAAVAAGAPALVAVSASSLASIGVVVAAELRWRGFAGVRGARPRFFVAALLVGSSLWYLALQLVEWLTPEAQATPQERMVSHAALPATVIAAAVLPAIAEELVFRGVLARGLARRLGPWLAIVLSAIAFALFHLQLVQLLPIFVIGLGLGVIAVRADSALPSMLAHALNNAIAIVLVRVPDAWPTRWMIAHPQGAFVAACVLVAGGVALALPAGGS